MFILTITTQSIAAKQELPNTKKNSVDQGMIDIKD
jgi:hypothetical protein